MKKPIIRDYEPPCTLWMRVELEHGILVASKDPVVINQTIVTIERQDGANRSVFEGDNVVADNDFSVTW